MTIEIKCVTWSTDSIIKVEENRSKANIKNLTREIIEIISVDKCVTPQESAADYVISKHGEGDVIIELKGKGIDKAIAQVRATAQHWNRARYREGKMAALIVGNHCPSANTSTQIAREKFKKDFGFPLHIVTKNYEYELENLYSFNGPHKRDK